MVVMYVLVNVITVVFESLEKKKNLENAEVLNNLSTKLSLYIHETQKER